jgi:hypothetical protein
MTNDCSKRTLEIIGNGWSNISVNNRSGNDQCLLRPNDSRKVSQKSGRIFFLMTSLYYAHFLCQNSEIVLIKKNVELLPLITWIY